VSQMATSAEGHLREGGRVKGHAYEREGEGQWSSSFHQEPTPIAV
jgi:hypothetical protein